MKKTMTMAMILSGMIAFAQNGNVGINIENPNATLSVKAKTNNGSKVLELQNSQSAKLVNVLDNGNVGIGVENPTKKLEVVGDIKASSLAGTGIRPVVADSNGVLSIGNTTIIGDGGVLLYPIGTEFICSATTIGSGIQSLEGNYWCGKATITETIYEDEWDDLGTQVTSEKHLWFYEGIFFGDANRTDNDNHDIAYTTGKGNYINTFTDTLINGEMVRKEHYNIDAYSVNDTNFPTLVFTYKNVLMRGHGSGYRYATKVNVIRKIAYR